MSPIATFREHLREEPVGIMLLLEFESLLKLEGVLTSGFTGTPQSLFCYGTTINYGTLKRVLSEIGADSATPETWSEFIRYYVSQGYLSPMSTLLACELARFLGRPSPINT